VTIAKLHQLVHLRGWPGRIGELGRHYLHGQEARARSVVVDLEHPGVDVAILDHGDAERM
jgi:hypothetical protein